MTGTVALRISLVTLTVAIGVGVLAFFVAPMVLGDTQSPAGGPEATAPARGVIYQLPLRVLNLSPGGQFTYLKIDMALELEPLPPADGHDANGEKTALGAEIDELMAAVEDGINMAVTSRTSDSLITAEGKAALKDEIRRLASDALGHPVRNVYFTQFVMQ